jgi:hypothetical protein
MVLRFIWVADAPILIVTTLLTSDLSAAPADWKEELNLCYSCDLVLYLIKGGLLEGADNILSTMVKTGCAPTLSSKKQGVTGERRSNQGRRLSF